MTSRRLEDLCARLVKRQDELLEQSVPDPALRQAIRRNVERKRGGSALGRARLERGWWVVAAALVSASVVGLGVWLMAAPAEPLRFRVGERNGILHALEWAPSSRELALDFSDGSSFTLVPEARARVVAVGPRGADLVIESGHALAEIVPRAGSPGRWHVRTGPFEVEVKGTRFDIGWDPRTEEFSLRLFQGEVSIAGCSFGTGIEVRANEQVQASCRRPDFDRRPLDDAVGPAESAPPAVRAVPPRNPAADAGSGAENAAYASSAAREAHASARAMPSLRRRWVTLARQGRFEQAYALARHGFDIECHQASIDEVLLLADTARHAQHADQARVAYLAIRRRATHTAETAAAAFELGRLDFDIDPESSSRWFELSLAERPRGPLAQAARDRLLEAAFRFGDGERLRRLAARYLDESPEGPRAKEAREILKRGSSAP